VDISSKDNDKRTGSLAGRCLKSRCHTFLALGGRLLRKSVSKGNDVGDETLQLERTQFPEEQEHCTTASAVRLAPLLCQREVAYGGIVVAWAHEYVNLVLVPQFNANQDGASGSNSRTDKIQKNGWRFGCTVHLAHNGEANAGA
jgi:hypothetical protein